MPIHCCPVVFTIVFCVLFVPIVVYFSSDDDSKYSSEKGSGTDDFEMKSHWKDRVLRFMKNELRIMKDRFDEEIIVKDDADLKVLMGEYKEKVTLFKHKSHKILKKKIIKSN
eukprot:737257_1